MNMFLIKSYVHTGRELMSARKCVCVSLYIETPTPLTQGLIADPDSPSPFLVSLKYLDTLFQVRGRKEIPVTFGMESGCKFRSWSYIRHCSSLAPPSVTGHGSL